VVIETLHEFEFEPRPGEMRRTERSDPKAKMMIPEAALIARSNEVTERDPGENVGA
jgi:hypothetical protein